MNKENLCADSKDESCGGRREFLVSASAVAGGLMLSLSGLPIAAVTAQTEKPADQTAMKNAAADDVTLKLDEKSPLAKVGGSQTIDTKAGKVIIVRTGEMNFVALSAVCPHKGGPIKYDEKAKQLFCPWHSSKFGTDGSNQGGPAKQPLKSFGTQSALVVSIKS